MEEPKPIEYAAAVVIIVIGITVALFTVWLVCSLVTL